MHRILRYNRRDWDRAKRTIPFTMSEDIVPEVRGKHVILSYATQEAYEWIVETLGEPILLNPNLDIRAFWRGYAYDRTEERFRRKEVDREND
jgi:hypothetical protein